MVDCQRLVRKSLDAHDGYSKMEFMDRIQAIRMFVRVVELGSFSKAAAELGIGQPAATKQVARMESQLGARLLHRSTHGVTPTEIGTIYYEKCRLIAHQVEEAESVASLLQSQVSGGLRVSTSVAFGQRVLAPLLMQFMKDHSGLQIDLNVDDHYVDLIEQGVDLAIRMGRLSDSTLGARYLGLNPWVLVASPAYLRAKGRPKRPEDLSELNALIYSIVQGDARWRFSGPDHRSASVPIKGPLRSNSLSVLLESAEQGMGVAALPCYIAEDALRAGAVVPVLEEWSLPAQEIHAVYPSPRMVPFKVSGLIAWLQEQFADGWWARPPAASTESGDARPGRRSLA